MKQYIFSGSSRLSETLLIFFGIVILFWSQGQCSRIYASVKAVSPFVVDLVSSVPWIDLFQTGWIQAELFSLVESEGRCHVEGPLHLTSKLQLTPWLATYIDYSLLLSLKAAAMLRNLCI